MEGSPVIKKGAPRMPGVPFRVRGRGLEPSVSVTGRQLPLVRQRFRQEARNCHSLCLCEFQAACNATKAGCVLHWRGRHAIPAEAQKHATGRRRRRHQLSVVALHTTTNTTINRAGNHSRRCQCLNDVTLSRAVIVASILFVNDYRQISILEVYESSHIAPVYLHFIYWLSLNYLQLF